MNNLEYDHADIFENLDAIKKQFHHLVRTVPGNGLIIAPSNDANLKDVIQRGCWTAQEYFDAQTAASSAWSAKLLNSDGSAFAVYWGERHVGDVHWDMLGLHNVNNALAAIAAARHAGVIADQAVAALNEFKGIKRRLELRGEVRGVKVYDDFAHHPTAIATTLQGLRQRIGKDQRILVAFEARSNTMKMGVHRSTLGASFADADSVLFFQPDELKWSFDEVVGVMGGRGEVHTNIDEIVACLTERVRTGDHIVVMSNGGFGGIHQKLLTGLAA